MSSSTTSTRTSPRPIVGSSATPTFTSISPPTRASWLNQVEIWFSILEGKSLHGASFNSIEQLRAHIDAFIESYNQNAKPFVWTKAKVHQKRLKARFANQ